MRAWIGTSGWVYRHWKGIFYPTGLPATRELSFYAGRFPTVEINYSFYRLPARDNFERWRDETPEGFTIAVKASRFLTHVRKLKDPEEPLANLLDRAAGLGDKLGPILFQFPPNWPKDMERLRAFLPLLPGGIRFAFEFRNQTWLSPDVYQALRSSGCALCVPDHPRMPREWMTTSDFTYLRMHSGATSACYSHEELEGWANRIGDAVEDGLDAYVYFNNDVEGYALDNARAFRDLLRRRLGSSSAELGMPNAAIQVPESLGGPPGGEKFTGDGWSMDYERQQE